MHKNVQKSAQIYPASIFAMHLDFQLDQKDICYIVVFHFYLLYYQMKYSFVYFLKMLAFHLYNKNNLIYDSTKSNSFFPSITLLQSSLQFSGTVFTGTTPQMAQKLHVKFRDNTSSYCKVITRSSPFIKNSACYKVVQNFSKF